ncbi:MAG: hypothetical protein PF795_03955, partial [Kiritimatiellae bacterium]|jgi:hypothetical protein|nr:hypothetical protein [Kiritimatiellia bacterium]
LRPVEMKRLQKQKGEKPNSNEEMPIPESWEDVEKLYRPWLYTKGLCVANDPFASPQRRNRRGVTSFEVLKVFAESM